MNRKTLKQLTLTLALTLGLGSCQDTCLTDGDSSTGGDNTEVSAETQRYRTLETLLGALADVDSLPDNWNSPSYTVTPTVGVLKSEAEPHIRYVATTSQAEADRIYRSYLSKDVTGEPTNDSWQMQGIGSMQFKLENSANHFATLKVQVQQLPQLEEIRFVSEDYLGENGWFSPKGTYYSFGDVVVQDVVGTDGSHTPTFWVCVRPCSNNPKSRKSHWCSFQMVPEGAGPESNYQKVDGNCYLPTNLSLNKSDAERMIQNFFNVLRLIALPSLAHNSKYEGIDAITPKNEQASYTTLRNTSDLWNYMGMWNKEQTVTIDGATVKGTLMNKNYKPSLMSVYYWMEYLKETVRMNAYYQGYTTNKPSEKGDYTVYSLTVTAPENSLFTQVKKNTAYVKKSDKPDFRTAEQGDRAPMYVNLSSRNSGYHYLVKYRTGAELEGLSHSTIDVDPSKPFSARPANRIADLLVLNDFKKRPAYSTYQENGQEKTLLPYFAIGDQVTSQLNEKGKETNTFLFCVRNAHTALTPYVSDAKTKALFLSDGRGNAKYKVTPTREDIATGLFRLLKAQLIFNADARSYFENEDIIYYDFIHPQKGEVTYLDGPTNRGYLEALRSLAELTTQNEIFCHLSLDVTGNAKARITANIDKKLYTLEVTHNSQNDYSYRLYEETNYKGRTLQPLCFFAYDDTTGFVETFSVARTLATTVGAEREAVKNGLAEELAGFLQKVEYEF